MVKKFRMTLGKINYHNLVNHSKNRTWTMKVYNLCRDIQSCFDFFGINCSLLLLIFSNLVLYVVTAYCISGTRDPRTLRRDLEIDKDGTQVGPCKLTRVGPKWNPGNWQGWSPSGTLKLTRVGPKWDPTVAFYKNLFHKNNFLNSK